MTGAVPRVSVGMPVYNCEEFVGEAIQSILDQTVADLELVISDNASTDDTFDISAQFASDDPRVRLIRNPTNMGAAANYNRVFREARAPLFKWASGNDVCHRLLIESALKVLDARPDAVLAYPKTIIFTEDMQAGQALEEDLRLDERDPCRRVANFFDRVRLNNMMNGIVRADALRRTPLHGCYRGSDLPMMVALLLEGPFIESPHFHFYRRMDARSATRFQSEEEVNRHFDPTGSNRLMFQSLKLHFAYFSCVLHSRLEARQKLALTGQLLHRAAWDRQRLIGETLRSCSRLLRSRVMRRG